MRVVPGLIKDGKIEVFIEVPEDPDTLEVAGLVKEDEEADEEGAADSADEGEEGHEEGEEADGDEDEEDDEGEDEDDDEPISRLDSVGDAVAAVCETLYRRLQASLDEDEAPSEFRIEFGITLAGSQGIPVVSQGESPATFKVTVKWENA
jgi:hypothetical protein